MPTIKMNLQGFSKTFSSSTLAYLVVFWLSTHVVCSSHRSSSSSSYSSEDGYKQSNSFRNSHSRQYDGPEGKYSYSRTHSSGSRPVVKSSFVPGQQQQQGGGYGSVVQGVPASIQQGRQDDAFYAGLEKQEEQQAEARSIDGVNAMMAKFIQKASGSQPTLRSMSSSRLAWSIHVLSFAFNSCRL